MESKSLNFRMFEQINEWKSMCILKKLNLRNEFILWYPGNGREEKIHYRKEKYSYLLYFTFCCYPMLLYDTMYDALTDRKPLSK